MNYTWKSLKNSKYHLILLSLNVALLIFIFAGVLNAVQITSDSILNYYEYSQLSQVQFFVVQLKFFSILAILPIFFIGWYTLRQLFILVYNLKKEERRSHLILGYSIKKSNRLFIIFTILPFIIGTACGFFSSFFFSKQFSSFLISVINYVPDYEISMEISIGDIASNCTIVLFVILLSYSLAAFKPLSFLLQKEIHELDTRIDLSRQLINQKKQKRKLVILISIVVIPVILLLVSIQIILWSNSEISSLRDIDFTQNILLLGLGVLNIILIPFSPFLLIIPILLIINKSYLKMIQRFIRHKHHLNPSLELIIKQISRNPKHHNTISMLIGIVSVVMMILSLLISNYTLYSNQKHLIDRSGNGLSYGISGTNITSDGVHINSTINRQEFQQDLINFLDTQQDILNYENFFWQMIIKDTSINTSSRTTITDTFNINLIDPLKFSQIDSFSDRWMTKSPVDTFHKMAENSSYAIIPDTLQQYYAVSEGDNLFVEFEDDTGNIKNTTFIVCAIYNNFPRQGDTEHHLDIYVSNHSIKNAVVGGTIITFQSENLNQPIDQNEIIAVFSSFGIVGGHLSTYLIDELIFDTMVIEILESIIKITLYMNAFSIFVAFIIYHKKEIPIWYSIILKGILLENTNKMKIFKTMLLIVNGIVITYLGYGFIVLYTNLASLILGNFLDFNFTNFIPWYQYVQFQILVIFIGILTIFIYNLRMRQKIEHKEALGELTRVY
jgi:hypothetical protein